MPPCQCDPDAIEWIRDYFSDCVYTNLDVVGFIVGLSSVVFWLVAQLPQFVSNIRRQSADGLSPWFLFQWLSGDTLNLLGCILTGDQLPTETYTATYFIFADCCIISQYVYYQILTRDKIELESDVCESADNSLHKPAEGYYITLGQGEEKTTAKNKLLQDSRSAADGKSALLTKGEQHKERHHPHHHHAHHHNYKPVTFVTGRSGAVMIAHAWQGPHKPQSPGIKDAQKTDSKGKAVVQAPARVRSKSQERRRVSANDQASSSAQGETDNGGPSIRDRLLLKTVSGDQILPSARGLADSPSPRPINAGMASGLRAGHEQRRKEEEESRKRAKRNMRRVVEKYGLEYGPPLHSRLTIHHGREPDLKLNPVSVPSAPVQLDGALSDVDRGGGTTNRGEYAADKRLHGGSRFGRAGVEPGQSCVSQQASFQAEKGTEQVKICEQDLVGKTQISRAGTLLGTADRGSPKDSSSQKVTVGGGSLKSLACVAGLFLCTTLLQSMTGNPYTASRDLTSPSFSHYLGSAVVISGVDSVGLGRRGLKSFPENQKQELQMGSMGQGISGHAGWLRLTTDDNETTARLDGKPHMAMCGTSNSVWWIKHTGLVLGWVSAAFYLGSRVSQISQNYQRKSAEGLSLAMFMCAFCANIAYGAAILLRADGWATLVGKAPWLLGSFGTLSLDVTIYLQALFYNKQMEIKRLETDAAEETHLLA
eukprot:jgi/Mesen1/431/ME001000S10635